MMTSQTCNSNFDRLAAGVQRWVWQKGWNSLRQAQEAAIPALINADRDVIISAATAAGKTEAAFLPIVSHLLLQESMSCAIYIAPLKALINDQWRRLLQLCEDNEIPVIPWHGDISASRKAKFLKDPRGILLITPESLEAILVRRGPQISSLLGRVSYLVIDEMHAFIGDERGRQLQSIMSRIESAVGRKISRVGLSATLGDMSLAKAFLRSREPEQVLIIESPSTGAAIKLVVKGYYDHPEIPADAHPLQLSEDDLDATEEEEEQSAPGLLAIANELYKLRGHNNLVFPNRRALVEWFSASLKARSEQNGVRNEFLAHHGNLSKAFREETEAALKSGDLPTTAIATSTLEMGIDIGDARTVAQIGAPPSVSSLRQRLGRSGRREGESPILRCHLLEKRLPDDLSSALREQTLQTAAMIDLMLSGWCEPPNLGDLHPSTFVHQLLAIICQFNGVTASKAWRILCREGEFALSKEEFVGVIRHLHAGKVILQMQDTTLVLGPSAEMQVNSFEFYSVFQTAKEYRVADNGKILGTLPLENILLPGERVLFAGRGWLVECVDTTMLVIHVKPASGGKPPKFISGRADVHPRVRAKMRQIISEDTDLPHYLDAAAKQLITEGRKYFHENGLANCSCIEKGESATFVIWDSDRIKRTLAMVLLATGYQVSMGSLCFNVACAGLEAMARLKAWRETEVNLDDLLPDPQLLQSEKWDWAVPAALLRKNYANSRLDIDGAKEWIARHL